MVLKLYVFDGGRAHLPDMNHLTPDRNVEDRHNPHPDVSDRTPKGLVVFDTGVDTDVLGDPYLDADPECRIDRQIRRVGYEPADVAYVLLSHLHMDHIGCAGLFPQATFVVRRSELRAVWWPDAYEHGYDFNAL